MKPRESKSKKYFKIYPHSSRNEFYVMCNGFLKEIKLNYCESRLHLTSKFHLGFVCERDIVFALYYNGY